MNQAYTLKPRDIAITFGILLYQEENWSYEKLSQLLHISKGSISNSVKRLKYARLLFSNGDQIRVAKRALLKFTKGGLAYSFPTQLGEKVSGIPTSYSTYPLQEEIISNGVNRVWEHPNGSTVGHSVLPLYPNAPSAALKNSNLHSLFALIDAVRLQEARPYAIAMQHLEALIQGNNSSILTF